MSERFFSQQPVAGERATLEGPEAHHLTRVMRAKVGDSLVLFDGSGAEFDVRITAVGRSSLELAVLARREVDRELPGVLTLAVALPKGERQRWLVEKCVELGVARLVPLAIRRGVAQPEDKALDRLRRAVIEASKQCGRNRLMEIAAPQSLAQCPAAAETTHRLIAQPAALHALRGIDWPAVTADTAPAVIVAIGPEGGFADDELAAACKAGWQAVHLGSRILRVETAALYIAAWAAAQWSAAPTPL